MRKLLGFSIRFENNPGVSYSLSSENSRLTYPAYVGNKFDLWKTSSRNVPGKMRKARFNDVEGNAYPADPKARVAIEVIHGKKAVRS